MRRRLGRFLPIVMLALMVQIFAPIVACRAATLAAADPLAAALICSGGGKSGQADQNGGHHRGGCCAVCCMAQTAAPVDQPDPVVFIDPERQVYRVTWLPLQQQAVTEPAYTHAQARAPPEFS